MRRRRSPLLSVLVVLALLCSAPTSVPRRCDRCPGDCPMHAHDKHLGCHSSGMHAVQPARDGCAFRSGCGGSPATTSDATIPAVLVVATVAPPELAPRTLIAARSARAARAAPEPALDPPRPATV